MVPSTGYNKTRTAVFISGKGSNLESLIKFSRTFKSPISIDFIISNNSKAKGLNYSKIYKIKKKVFSFKNKNLSEKKLLSILKIFPKFKPLDLELLEIIISIEIGDFFSFENFIRDFKLLPVPEIKTAVFIFLVPVDRAIKFYFIFTCRNFSNNVWLKFFGKILFNTLIFIRLNY